MKRYIIIVVAVLLVGVWTADTFRLEQNSIETQRHSMIFVEINGTSQDVSSRYSLDSGLVRFESNHSGVVRTRSKHVTWSSLLNDMELDYNRINETHVCIRTEETLCGKGRISLNGEKLERDTLIRQGDILVITVQDESPEQTVDDYLKNQLPRRYKEYDRVGERA
jgi:hypothetical protein